MKVNVCISQTLSANVEVNVKKNFSELDLREAIKKQIELPSDAVIGDNLWCVDDFAVMIDN